jgi:hypothetical protein
VARMGKILVAYKVLAGKDERKGQCGRRICRCEDDT